MGRKIDDAFSHVDYERALTINVVGSPLMAVVDSDHVAISKVPAVLNSMASPRNGLSTSSNSMVASRQGEDRAILKAVTNTLKINDASSPRKSLLKVNSFIAEEADRTGDAQNNVSGLVKEFADSPRKSSHSGYRRMPSGISFNGWKLRANPLVLGCNNPIRMVTDSLKMGNCRKQMVSLAQGDPAVFGSHMRVPEAAVDALVQVTKSCNFNGYALSKGLLECRSAVADYLSGSLTSKVSPEDVIMTSGCSQAIQHCVSALSFHGCNILVPRPGFPVYDTICQYYGVEIRYYDLLNDNGWHVNLNQVVESTDSFTAAIILCNPGNPSGCVYGYKHLSQIATMAQMLKIPIISDEVYAEMVFGEEKYVPMATFSSQVPVLTVGSVSKRWLAPGWRLGWISISDPQGILEKTRIVEALGKIVQMTLGPSTLVQAAFPNLLSNTAPEFLERLNESLRSGAEFTYKRIRNIHGLECPVKPQGSMFMMVRIDPLKFKDLKNDTEFAAALVNEESVLVLPGTAFGLSNWLRVVFALSLPSLEEAWDRIAAFCSSHSC